MSSNVAPQQTRPVIARKGFYHFLSPREIHFSPALTTVACYNSPAVQYPNLLS